MNDLIASLNHWSAVAGHFAFSILWQSSVLIGAVYFLDLVLRKKVAANFRYLLWLLVLVKLLLPPGFASPTSAAWWLRAELAGAPRPSSVVVTYGPLRPPPPAPAFAPAARLPARETLSLPARAVLVSVGMSFALLAFAIKRWAQLRRHASLASPAPPWLLQIATSAQQQIGLNTKYRLRMDGGASSPALFGLLHPIILLPQALAERLSPAQIRAILLHELLHLKRGDVWVHCAQTLLQIVFWWHPLLWFANRKMRAVREEAVDDSAMTVLRAEAEIYPPTLLEVAKLAIHHPLSGLGMVGILESRNVFRKRIERLLAHSAPQKKLTMLSFIGLILFSAVALPMGQAPARPVKESGIASTAQANSAPSPDSAGELYLPHFRMRHLTQGTNIISEPEWDFLGYTPVAAPLLLPARKTDNGNAVNSDEKFGYEAYNDEQNLASRRLNASAESKQRVFRVDTNTIRENMLKQGLISREAPEIGRALGRLLAEAASNTPEENPLRYFYAEGKGTLLISGSDRQIRLAAQALDNLSNEVGGGSPHKATTTPASGAPFPATPVPQVNIKAKFVEFPSGDSDARTVESLVKKLLPRSRVENPSPGVVILSPTDAASFRDALQKRRGAKSKSEASVTTLSERQTEIQCVDLKTVVTGLDTHSNINYTTESIPCGSTLESLATVASDNLSINLVVDAHDFEFLGYADPRGNNIKAIGEGKRENTFPPLPRFLLRNFDVPPVEILDGQTVLFRNSDANIWQYNSVVRADTKAKPLFILITVKLIDAKGAPFH